MRTLPPLRLSGLMAVLCLAGCQAFIISPPSQPPSPRDPLHPPDAMPGPAFQCDPTQAPPDPLLRLTEKQFLNTLQDLFVAGSSTANKSAFQDLMANDPSITAFISAFPTEGSYGKGNTLVYDTEDQRISNLLLQNQINIVFAVTTWLTANAGRLSDFVSAYGGAACAGKTVGNTGIDKGCYDAFITGFGLRVLRRPVETSNNAIDATGDDTAAANDLAFYEGIYNDPTSGGFDALIPVMLLAPDSLFVTQFKGAATNLANQTALTPYETAAKLSYYFTDSTPDDALMAAAAAGFSGQGLTVSEQVDRLFSLSRTRQRLGNFYTQWIRPAAVPALLPATNAPSLDLSSLRANAIQELVDLADYYTFGVPGRLADVVTSNLSFAKTADVAGLYGVSAWPGKNTDGSYDPSTLVTFPADNPRAGMFTRAAFAFSGVRDSNPIIRGARIFKDYMCRDISPPAAFVLSPTVPLSGPPTVRNIVIANTEIPGSACAGCHKPFINPLGFPLENYDAFGRYRQTENIYAADNSVTQTVAIDATSSPMIDQKNDRPVNGGIELSDALAPSVDLNSCFIRHYFRFSQGKAETSADNCTMNEMLNLLTADQGGGLANLVKGRASSASFRVHNIAP
jgi:hypothetical protein